MQTEAPIVHIVDDDEALRNSLSELFISKSLDTRLYDNAETFLASSLELKHGCILLDLRMPGKSGLEVQQSLINSECPLPVIFLTGHGSIRVAVTAMKKGAVEFLVKPVDNDQLIAAAKRAIEQSKSAVEKASIRTHLTEREVDVDRLVETGKLNKEIALELGVTEKTVEFHKKNIREKKREYGNKQV